MKFAFSLLGALCLLHLVTSQCDLSKRVENEEDFPNIETESALSYQMGVEFTLPGAKQTDYYLEYYDTLNRRGRVESHQAGRTLTFIYRTETNEAWNIDDKKCERQEVTETPDFFRDDQTNWLYIDPKDESKRTIGPSAMFKIAYSAWNGASRRKKMAYMGKAEKLIRGMKAQYWRRCDDKVSYVDYYFTLKEVDNPYDLKILKFVPLRVVFGGTRTGEQAALQEQYYDIMTFQPMISTGLSPFELPKARNCIRGNLTDPPTVPTFAGQNLLFSAEVVYKKIKISEKLELSSYYSTLMMAIDQESRHLAYYYSPWNTTVPLGSLKQKTIIDAPEFVIYDMRFEYIYKINYESGKCEVGRTRDFLPKYKLPENGGSITLTDPYILFPNNELNYLTNSSERGLAVDVFEAKVDDYFLDRDTQIPKAIITHTYLKENEVMDNTAMVKKAPLQAVLRFYRKDDIEEILTFNFFGFTTRLIGRSQIFGVSRCFENDDDYLWLTLGFEADNAGETDLITLSGRLWGIRRAMMSYITLNTALTPVRVPIILVTPRPTAIYVTMLILGKPTNRLDFPDVEENKVIDTTDMDGLSDFESCTSACLQMGECWGVALCDAVCYYGSATNKNVKERNGCTLYKRYNNETFTMPSKEVSAENIRMQVQENNVKLKIPTADNKEIILVATSSFVSEPAEDDPYFRRLGRELNQRMRIVKVGKKLKKGDTVKNLGTLNFDQCQRLCLDFKDCETVSYCLKDSVCTITPKYGEDIKDEDMENDDQCNLVTRKYADHFTRTPGIVLSETASSILKVQKVEDCARACVQETKFKCLSFDHCASEAETPCRLHVAHYVNAKTREAVQKKSSRCGHYTKRYSMEFKRNAEKKMLNTNVPPIRNVTLEECAKNCVEYGGGVCYGYDFCQDSRMLATSCILLDANPSGMKSAYSSICTNYVRSAPEYNTPRPYTTGYAAGIGVLCFIVGGIVGAVIIFIIAYVRVNRR